ECGHRLAHFVFRFFLPSAGSFFLRELTGSLENGEIGLPTSKVRPLGSTLYSKPKKSGTDEKVGDRRKSREKVGDKKSGTDGQKVGKSRKSREKSGKVGDRRDVSHLCSPAHHASKVSAPWRGSLTALPGRPPFLTP